MAINNVTATFSREEIFEAFQEQVDPALHDVLRKEIDRRWPEGYRLHVHLVMPPAEPTKSAE